MKPSRTLTLFILLSSLALLAVATTNSLNGGFNHRSQAIPGGPYRFPDLHNAGSTLVRLDGHLSHSHFFDPSTGVTGRIVSHRWTVPPNRTICSTEVCTRRFPVGMTSVTIFVRDSTGDTAPASTTVTVFHAVRPRIRIVISWPGAIRPHYSLTLSSLKMTDNAVLPTFLRTTGSSARVYARLNLPRNGFYQFRLLCGGGRCAMRLNAEKLLEGGHGMHVSNWTYLPHGFAQVEVFFRREQSPHRPALSLEWKNPLFNGAWGLAPPHRWFHIPYVIPPVLYSTKTERAMVGIRASLTGSSFLGLKEVQILGFGKCFGPVVVNQFLITCVVPYGLGPRSVRVVTAVGISNSLPLEAVPQVEPPAKGFSPGFIGYYQPVAFKKAYLTKRDGNLWKAKQLTAITLGPDGRFYIGSLNGSVYALAVDLGHVVRGECRSDQIGFNRSILGLAFNPAQTSKMILYASTSILSWKSKNVMFPSFNGWSNGEVIAMEETSNSCLEKTRTVISGLPVSNYDHAVNGISFDQSGALLVTVGGTSNAGVSEETDNMGGIPDSPLSGAMLIAPVQDAGFDGHIKYSTNKDPAIAWKVGGHVYVYASGLRNSFCHVVHSNGHIYATDNGANAGFGARSTSCNSEIASWTEKDSLHMIRKGGYCGHANRNRGRRDGKQCVHKNGQYELPITEFESSTNGIIEYTANTFGGQMRGDLLATKYAVYGEGKTFRVHLDPKGRLAKKYELASFSGNTAAMSPTGAVLMPRVYQSKVSVLVPIETNPGLTVVTSVNPFRGPRRGGNRITVTGWNLYKPLNATVGGRPCTGVGELKGGRSFSCSVPSGQGRVPVVVTRIGMTSKSYRYEYWYLDVW